MATTSRNRSGFTLVELLVVIAIIGVLMGLLIPAVNSIRESSRLAQCRGNLRQLAQATTSYANVSAVMPSQGTAGRFGDSNALTLDTRGGWLYLILPFVEQQPLHDLGAGLTGASLTAAVTTRVQTALALYTCASRGSAIFTAPPLVAWQTAYPGVSYSTAGGQGFATAPALLARSDYAGSGGFSTGTGGFAYGAFGRNAWSDSARMLEEIVDGQSNVLLCGERYLPPDEYRPAPRSSPTEWVNGRRNCNDKGWSVGGKGDVYAAAQDGASTLMSPLADDSGVENCTVVTRVGRFGSPHGGVPMAMVDGSVRVIDFNVSQSLFVKLFHIADGGAADDLD